MDSLQQRLLGELIGLARATDGNEHLITADSTSVILDCLSSAPKNEEELQSYLGRIEATKRSMVPDCFLCANPCGRTSAYDFMRMQDDPDIAEIKHRIIRELRSIASQKWDPSLEARLYRGLIVIGLDGYSAPELYPIFTGIQP